MKRMEESRAYAELSDVDAEDGEPPSVALVPWSRGIMARRSHAPRLKPKKMMRDPRR